MILQHCSGTWPDLRINPMNELATTRLIADRVARYGLCIRGAFNLRRQLPAFPTAEAIVLVGSRGSEFWSHFKTSEEFHDGQAHPLDRWSKKLGDTLAKELGGQAAHPNDGPPYHPFLQWAKEAESLESSPISVAMHPQYGLWHAYRFALLLPKRLLDINAPSYSPDVCDSCALKPCLNSCPVNAFSSQGYDVDTCYRYLVSDKTAPCHQRGCIARRACPEAVQWQYSSPHAAFHMAAFLTARAEQN